mgnify:CR=1 FL=1
MKLRNKKQIIELVNAATLKITVPEVSKQKQEYYKAGVRDLIKQLGFQIDKINEN